MSRRILSVDPAENGRPLAEWLAHRLSIGREAAQRLIRERQVRLAGAICTDVLRRVREGQRIEVPPSPKKKSPPNPSPPKCGAGEIVVRHVDEQVIVVDKPAGLTTMRHREDVAGFGARARQYLPPTLADLLPGLIGRPRSEVRAVHRLDRDTSGLVVFARTREAERHLGQQFRAHSTERLYRALVRGQAKSGRIESWLVADRGDGRRGSSPEAGKGQRAVTHVEVREPLGDFTLVECRLETGRTHQVRIHLGEAGTPLCGERVYDRPLHGRPAPDGSGCPRIALHAATLGFEHPATRQRVAWTAPLPADLQRVFDRLRNQM